MKTYQTRTAAGQTCHVGLTSRRRADALAREWSRLFPEHAPYTVHTRG